ncbi:S-layer homology domain-containing protein [Pseudomonas sp. ISL-84]|nr:S-layer homology domain-containing protein [Pseudomonas sp. ISL-84]
MLGLITSPASAAMEESIRYLALGDSLAAGMTSDKQISLGYSDMAAEHLKGQGLLDTYSKAFAVPGYTTENVLSDLTEKEELKAAIKQANVITISAGANDLLKEAKIDREKGTLNIDPATIKPTLQSIAANYIKILQTIKELNPEAAVYVMGYYFPFPYLSDVQKPQLIELTQTLNKTIQAASATKGATFVSVYEKFGDDPKPYVPNPEDIHPNLEGYKLMSEALLESMAKSKQAADLPEGHWAEKELNLFLDNNLFQLDEKGNIHPGKAITRAEVAGVLYKSIPMTQSLPANPGFKDVPESHPAYMAIAKLTEAGIFAKSEYFNPDAPLTRVQMAKVLTLTFQLKDDGMQPRYSDIPKDYWGSRFISAMTVNELMYGHPNGTFGVNDAATRAQFAVVMVRAAEAGLN